MSTKNVDEQVPRTLGAMFIGARSIYDAVKHAESAALSVTDKSSVVEALALKDILGRTRTQMEDLHSDVNVSDADERPVSVQDG